MSKLRKFIPEEYGIARNPVPTNETLYKLFQSNTESFDDYLARIIGGLGVEARDAKDNAARQGMVVTQFENLRDSTSGVSLDEELTFLIQFQRGYQAASRVITTVDEMFSTLINM